MKFFVNIINIIDYKKNIDNYSYFLNNFGGKMRRLVSFDWAMKKLLRSKANFGILEGFLSELLNDDIHILQILESEANKETFEDRFNRVDLKVMDSKKKIIIIEIQFERQFDFLQRILYGTSKAITEHMKETDPYSKVSKIISINILYFSLGDGEDYVYYGKTRFIGIHNKAELKLSEKQKKAFNVEEVSEIYPEYYLLEVTNFNNNATTPLDQWIYFLKNEEIKDDFTAKGLLEAKTTLDVLKMTDSERLLYENYQKQLHQDASMYESHYLDGKIDGKKEGIEEGLKKGIEKGASEEKIKIAKEMLEDGFSIKKIIKYTGLTEEEIEKIN